MKKKITAMLMMVILFFSWSTAVAASGEQTPSGIPLNNIETFIDDYISNYIGKTTPGAAIVLVKDGKIIFSKGYGYADKENQVLVDSTNTVFEYGSISKIFVYTTIMRLSEEGKIDLQADIRKYLPDGFLKNLKYDQPITMLNIMNHTAGFEDYFFDIILPSSENFPTLEQTLKKSQPMQVYKPGTVSAYSNYAVSLAAYIAERMVGQDFYHYLMEAVFEPTNMKQTSAHPTLEDYPELEDSKAMGYYVLKDGSFKRGIWSHIPIYPAGSVNGTAEDLARFAIALMPQDEKNSPLFNKRITLDEMLTQSHEIGPQLPGFAHGFIEWDGEYRGVGHGGNTAAFSSQMNIVPEEGFGVIVLTNAMGEMHITSGLTEALIGKQNKNVTIGQGNLPDATEVEGTYISARRIHRGFLEFYNYLSLLNVRVLESNKIQMSMGGQSGTFLQTSPYVYQRIDAQGALFEHHFGSVYFEVSEGKVQRVSGDYLPVPPGRSKPWLVISIVIVVSSVLYFLITPVALLIGKVRGKKAKMKSFSRHNKVQNMITLLVLSGTALLMNNGVLITRMLLNNYRSFDEVRVHIILNYPLTALAIMFFVLLSINLSKEKYSRGQKIFSIVTIVIIIAFIATLINWQFLRLIS